MDQDIDIIDFLPNYPNITNENFNKDIYYKKEFNDQKLSENIENIDKGFLKHQIFISRYLSQFTKYMGLLLFHEMGTGKSCSAFAVTEMLRKSNKYNEAIIVAPNRTTLKILTSQLINVCAPNEFINKTVKDTKFYTFSTFLDFTRYLESFQNNISLLNNKIIVIDEVHNLRSKIGDKEKTKKI